MPKAKTKTTKKATKKTVAKKTAKKTTRKAVKKATRKTAKKTTRKKAPQKDLTYATNTTSFWVSDGQVLNSLIALRDALDEMEKDVYRYHATGAENDFANWVEVVLCDGDCAEALRKAKTPKSARTVVVKHLKYYAI